MVGHIRYRDYLGKRELTIIALAFIATALTNYISLHLPIELEPYLALCPVIGLLFGPLGIIGVNAVSFILFVLTRRSSSHLARDIVWMDSLIGYAESKGADTSALRSIRDDASKGRWTAKGWVGTAFWLTVTAYTVIQGFILFYGTGSDDGRGLMPFVYVYLLVMAQFVFTLGTTAGFPYRHDQLQCEFSREFSARAARFGLEVDAMEPSVSKARWIVHIVLFAATLGVYSVVILLLANRRTNTHIRSQWGYESRVMISMIRHEDGVGIEGIGDNQPGNWLARLLFNAL